MPQVKFRLSAFGDEIAHDLTEQLEILQQLRIPFLELRGVWGKNVLDLSDEEAARVRKDCDRQGILISAIGSPIGKSPLEAPIEAELANLARIFRIAEIVGTRYVRVFSFYPPNSNPNVCYDDYVNEAIASVTCLTDLARKEGFTLLLENEKGIVGDNIARCHEILSAIHSPHLRFTWDPANFVQAGEERPTERGWPLLGAFVAQVHVKDARSADGSVVAAGEGDGQIPELLVHLRENDFQGYLALEPHLAFAGPRGGFSGVSGMTYAAEALRRLMVQQGCQEYSAPHEP
jgi:sugar phosphate isomerase/epimerase